MSISGKYTHTSDLPADIQERLARINEVLARHPLRVVYLFGSAVDDPARSQDIDIAVVPDEGFSYRALYADLSLLLNTDRLDLVDLRYAPAYLHDEILQQGRCVYARSPAEREAFEQQRKRAHVREVYSRWGRALEETPMPLRPEFIAHATAELERVTQELEKYQGATGADLAADLSLRWTVERGLLAGLTLVFQVADHILSQAFHRHVETFEGLLAELHTVGVLSEALYQDLRGAGGFRNVLVHEYVAIDVGEVAAVLGQAPHVFRRFREEILKWLEGYSETSPPS